MKTTELRKGLYFNVPRKDQCPFRIDVIEHLSDNYAKVGMKSGIYKHGNLEMEGHPLTWELKDLQPIPLTEDILLKCGFEKKSLHYYKRNGIIISIEDSHFEMFLGNILVNLKYIHQLQTLYFALTGEELEVNL